jgi:hypothetical protein
MAKRQTQRARVTDLTDETLDRPEGNLWTKPREPGEEAIAMLAYQLWLDRGSRDGSAEDDWFRAKEALGAAGETAKRGTAKPLNMSAGAST